MSLNLKDDEDIFGIKVDDTAKYYLLETMRWTKFVGILLSIVIVLICLVTTFYLNIYMPQYMQTSLPNGTAISISIFTILITLGIYFFPVFALLKFGSNINKAIKTGSQQHFNLALKYMKNLFKYIGIATIVIVLIYAVVFAISAFALRGAS